MTPYPAARQENLVVQQLQDELLVYDLKTNQAFTLNGTATLVYGLCDGNHSITEISGKLTKRLKQSVPEDLVRLAIAQFKENDLLEDGSRLEIKFNGLSRREAIRRAGFASMVALPVIASLVAPTAAMARSACIAAEAACSTSAQCCGGAPNCNGICCVSTTGATRSGRFISQLPVFSCPAAADRCDSLASLCCSGIARQGNCTPPGGGFAGSVECFCA